MSKYNQEIPEDANEFDPLETKPYDQQIIKKNAKEEILYWINKARRNDIDFTKLLTSFRRSFEYSTKQDEELDKAKSKNKDIPNSRYTNIKYRKVFDIQENGVEAINESLTDLIQTNPLIPLEFDEKLNKIAEKQFNVIKKRLENIKGKTIQLQNTCTVQEPQNCLEKSTYNKKLQEIKQFINHNDEDGNDSEFRIQKDLGEGSCAESFVIQEFNAKMIIIKHFLDLNNPQRLNRRIILSPDLQKVGIYIGTCPLVGALAVFEYYGYPIARFSYKFPYNKLDDMKWPEECTYLQKSIEKKYDEDEFKTKYQYTYKWPKKNKEDQVEQYELNEQAHALNTESQYYQLTLGSTYKIFSGYLEKR